MVAHLEENNLILDTQHGFRRGMSCVSNMLLYWDNLTSFIDQGIPVDVIYLDLQKAFDTVPHCRLLSKIQAHGIGGLVLQWIQEWLKDRRQRVVLNGCESVWTEVTSSVIQGSVLGPICFTIYMNDLDLNIISGISKFADDTKIICPIYSEHDKAILQEDLNTLMEWTRKWQMKFNVNKCAVLHFGFNNPNYQYFMDGKQLQSKEEEKDLGIIVTTSMNFSKHCASSVKKANQVIGLIKRNFHNFDRKIMINLYKSLVRPHLDYAVSVWKPYLRKDINLIEGVQRRMTKLISGMKDKTYEERLELLKLTSLEQRHKRQDLITAFNMTKGNIKIDLGKIVEIIGKTSTRGHSWKIRPKSSRLELRRNSFFCRIWKTWNALPEHLIGATTLNQFKTGLKDMGY